MHELFNNLSKDDSLIAVKLDSEKNLILAEYNSYTPREAASMIKVFYALEVFRRIEIGLIKNEKVEIKSDMVNQYGSNVLGDIVNNGNTVRFDLETLICLMLKYSCNSSTSILKKYFLPSEKDLEKLAHDIWGLRNLIFINSNGKNENKISLHDMFILYNWIYGLNPMLQIYNSSLKEKLRKSRNIFYLFDQLELQMLGSKSGTLFKNGFYWINDSGIVEIQNQKYFLGASVKRRKISNAVLQIRKIGKDLVNIIISEMERGR